MAHRTHQEETVMSITQAASFVVPTNPGGLFDSPDPRDESYPALAEASPVDSLPVAKTLLEELPPCFNQCQPLKSNDECLGSCTAQAAAGCFTHLHHKLTGEWITLSRPEIYYRDRQLMDISVDDDIGASTRTAFKALAEGVCDEAFWPYVADKFNVAPSQICLDDAQKNKIVSYFSLDHNGLRRSITLLRTVPVDRQTIRKRSRN